MKEYCGPYAIDSWELRELVNEVSLGDKKASEWPKMRNLIYLFMSEGAVACKLTKKHLLTFYYNNFEVSNKFYVNVKHIKGRIHWNFSFKAFHEIRFQGYFMKHKILSWNTFSLVSNIQKQSFRCVL